MLLDRSLPTLAMVSTDIRRDLVEPLRHFTRLRVVHFYRQASYGDLHTEELDESQIAYDNPVDLFRRLWQARPDIIQGVEPFSIRLLPYLYVAFGVALLRRRPLVVVSLENRPLAEKHGHLLSSILRLVLRPVMGYARAIVVLNEGVRRNVLSVGRYGGKLRRLMYGTWGVNLDEFTPRCEGRQQDFGAGPRVLFVGRLHAEKGIFDLLDAFARVKSRAPRARLVVVGDGPARVDVERTVSERGWTEDILLAGTVKNRDLPPFFRAADVFVAPSVTTRKWEEQVGMSSIQAMACGLPVVSTRCGAIPEYIPEGLAGILVPERDPASLAEAIIRVLSDPELGRRMGEAGRACAVERYDARTNIEEAESMLLHLLTG